MLKTIATIAATFAVVGALAALENDPINTVDPESAADPPVSSGAYTASASGDASDTPGDVMATLTSGQPDENLAREFWASSYERDSETGLDYAVGRFVSEPGISTVTESLGRVVAATAADRQPSTGPGVDLHNEPGDPGSSWLISERLPRQNGDGTDHGFSAGAIPPSEDPGGWNSDNGLLARAAYDIAGNVRRTESVPSDYEPSYRLPPALASGAWQYDDANRRIVLASNGSNADRNGEIWTWA